MPKHSTYDVIIIGGAIMGSSAAFWLSQNPDFNGRILVLDRDLTYQTASTSHTNSCIRQQFGTEVNIKISQFGVEFIKGFKAFMRDPSAPDISLHAFGYLYLADTQDFADALIANQRLQSRLGAGTQILTPDQMAEKWPFYNLDGIILGSHNPVDEGYFDGGTIFDWFRKKARQCGVEYLQADVVAISMTGPKATGVTLADGTRIGADTIVNASGPRANVTAQMAGLHIPVEARRRYTFIFDAAHPLDRDLPLTIDPVGVHMRTDGRYYMTGCPPDNDPAADFDDFQMDHSVWEDKVWPAIANRVPAFEQVKVINAWVGHYAYNTLDQNAVIGPHPEVSNFLFCNGFSGHGLQQSPAMGRGIAELVCYGQYRSLDLSPLGYDRVAANRPLLERAVI